MAMVKQDLVIDLEQFRVALVAMSDYAYERHGNMDHPHCLEADRLLALIDEQKAVTHENDHSNLCDLCSARERLSRDDDGISFCKECMEVWRSSWKPINNEVE